MKQIDTKEAAKRAAALCSKSEHCKAEMQARLRQWGITGNDAAIIIKMLEQEGYIDEERYAKAFANDRSKHAGWGKNKIAWQLKAKNIAHSAIQNAIDTIDEDEYAENMDKAMAAKARTMNEPDPAKRKNKLLRFAMARGFEYELAEQWIDKHNDD